MISEGASGEFSSPARAQKQYFLMHKGIPGHCFKQSLKLLHRCLVGSIGYESCDSAVTCIIPVIKTQTFWDFRQTTSKYNKSVLCLHTNSSTNVVSHNIYKSWDLCRYVKSYITWNNNNKKEDKECSYHCLWCLSTVNILVYIF